MVCSACAACELWWGIAGLNGFQGSKFICHGLWGAEAPGACPSSVGRCGKRPTGAKFDQSETHPMPSQAARPKTAVLLDSHSSFPSATLRRAHAGLHATSPERQMVTRPFHWAGTRTASTLPTKSQPPRADLPSALQCHRVSYCVRTCVEGGA